jgi:hypothetical protein
MFKLEFKARQQLETSRPSGPGGAARKRSHSAGGAGAVESNLNEVFHGDAAFRQQAMLHLRRLLNACSDGSYVV